jgi:hypothetical protein
MGNRGPRETVGNLLSIADKAVKIQAIGGFIYANVGRFFAVH